MIIQNAVTCNKCDDDIFSAHRHDFCECKCGNIFVDGGQEYLRRGGPGVADRSYTDWSWELPDEVYSACATAVQEAIDTNRNKFGIANAVMRKLRDNDHIIATGEYRVLGEWQDELMVINPDGSMNRYKKVVE
ncbi:hypothetical protein EBT25_11595 [bacterium]|nr:hypothetical protein [bacterium]